MIDVTNIDVRDIIRAAYDLSSPQGLGLLEWTAEPLGDAQVEELAAHARAHAGELHLDYVNGRAVKLSIWPGERCRREPGRSFMSIDMAGYPYRWYRHEDEDAAELLARIGAIPMTLTSENVMRVLLDCEVAAPYAMPSENSSLLGVRGIIRTFMFDPLPLERRRADIDAMLDRLPEQFHQETGGGWSFLNACVTRGGEQWTDAHAAMEALFALGMATGRVKECFPPEYWPDLPGGMPYYVVLAREAEAHGAQ